MRRILHIWTDTAPPLALETIRRQQQLPDCTVELADLTQPQPDYPALLEKIFTADSVEVW